MAVFEITTDENLLFTGAAKFARGTMKDGEAISHHANITAVRTKRKDGGSDEHVIGADRRVTVTDERAIRHLDADPRFTRIS
jgi:hypothetical protein